MDQYLFYSAITFIIAKKAYDAYCWYKRNHRAVIGEYYWNRLYKNMYVEVINIYNGEVFYAMVNDDHVGFIQYSSEKDFFINHKPD